MIDNTMTNTQLITVLAERDIRMWLDADELKFSAPRGAIDPELRALMVARKSELMTFLRNEASGEGEQSLAPAPMLDRPPLSAAEERLWFLYRLEGPSPAYNVLTSMHVPQFLDLALHRQAMARLVSRHEALRTCFAEENGEAYRVVRPPCSLPVSLVDLSGLPDDALCERQVVSILEREESHLFALDGDRLMRSLLLRIRLDRHVVVFNVHHAVTDAWSSGVLGREYFELVQAATEGRSVELPPLSVTYADFAHWQHSQLANDGLLSQLEFWESNLSGLPPLLTLPTDFPRPPVKRFQGRSERCVLPQQAVSGLATLSQRRGATLFMGLLAVFKLMLARYCNTSDIAVGTAVAGRRFQELSNVVGVFTNTVVIRTAIDQHGGFVDLLERVRDATLAAQSNQDVPFQAVVEKLAGKRSLSHTPLYQVSLALNNAADQDLAKLADFGQQYSDNDGIISTAVKDDLSLQFRQKAEGLEFKLTYDVHLFSQESAQRMMRHFVVLLEAVVDSPERTLLDLSLVAPNEYEQLLQLGGQSAMRPKSSQTLPELFDVQCKRAPDAIAVQQGDAQFSYRTLADIADFYCSELCAAGAQPYDRIGLSVEGVVELVAGMLAILKIGATYVPLDRSYPARVLNQMIADTGLRLALTTFDDPPWGPDAGTRLIRLCPAQACQQLPLMQRHAPGGFDPALPAYVMYTSGSTGTAKGIEVSHSAIVRLVQGSDYVVLSSDDILGQMSNHSFDAATFEIWGALTNGARLVDFDTETLLDTRLLPEFLRDHSITAAFLTVALFNVFADTNPRALETVRTVMFGGEAANPDAVREVFEHGKPKRLLNVYGPTENTVFSTWHEISTLSDTSRCPIGKPIAGSTAHVFDNAGQLAPIGVLGELLVGGDGVALGYVGRPDLTADRFVPDPFSTRPGQRLYRTGDFVKRGADGAIEFFGRLDDQVKVRGFRIEIREIEDQLYQHAAVSDAAVVVSEDDRGIKRLDAYLGTRESATVLVPELREFLRQRLPDYKLPSRYICLPQLPFTPNGKIDRARLPSVSSAQDGVVEAGGMGDELERQIAAEWCELLGLETVAAGDDFFELGGHSLLAITLSARLRDRYGIELNTRDVFEHSTLEKLAANVRQSEQTAAALPPIVPATRRQRSTLSFMQQRLWFLEQMQGPSATYHMPIALRLSPTYSPAQIEDALRMVVDRHDALRTRIVEVNGVPLQRVSNDTGLLKIREMSLTAADSEDPECMGRIIGEEVLRPFDLAVAPLLRALLIRLPPGEHILVITIHHIVFDGWSMGILLSEFGSLLKNPQTVLQELPLQYGDFAHWQKSWLDGEHLERQLGYWRKQLKDVPPLLQLSCAEPRSAERRDDGRTQTHQFGPDLTGRLKALALQESSSLFMVMLAALDVVLARYAGHGDIVVGTPIANRSRHELEPLIGFFANTLPLRTRVRNEQSFLRLLRQVRETTLDAYAHQHTPFDLIVDALGLERSLAYTPLVQVVLAQENFGARGQDLPTGVSPILLRDDNRTAKFDLNLSFEERDGVVQLYLEYNIDLFKEATIARLLQHYQLALEHFVASPEQPIDRMQFGTSEAEQCAIDALNAHASEALDTRSLRDQFADIVRRQPDSVAVTDEAGSLTYASLDAASEQFAQRMRSFGVCSETPVGICLERSAHLVIAVLGVIKAGGAYVPMDVDLVQERLESIAVNARLSLVVVDAETEARLAGWAAQLVRIDGSDHARQLPEATASTPDLGPDELAYLMYTSGSTGMPKGVSVTHGAVSRLVRNAKYLPYHQGLRFILSSSTSFDLATFEIWGPLLNGGLLVVSSVRPTDLDAFTRVLRRHHVDTLWLTSALFDAWVQHLDEDVPDLRFLLAGGDVVSAMSCARAHSRLPNVQLINGYGPTENTTFSSCFEIPRDQPADQPIPIGRSVSGSTCYVLDDNLYRVPVGLPGTLFVGGHGLARGYFDRPDLTAERFSPDPFSDQPGARLYCTGDRALLRDDGVLMYLGRTDRQVKIRGFRVEIGEIEALLKARAEIADAVVIVHSDDRGEKRLIAFAVPSSAEDDLSHLLADMRQTLPEYLLPSTVIPLEAMLTNNSGKVDRALLAARVVERDEPRDFVAPETETEREVAEIWSALLSRPRIGRHDRFFELGGHSLLAAQACAQINNRFVIDLRVRTFYSSPDLAALAAKIDDARNLDRMLDSIDLETLSEEQAELLLERMKQEV